MLDLYRWGNTLNRDLRDFVYLDVLNEAEEDSEKIEKVAKYIDDTMRKLVTDRELRKLITEREQEFSWEKVWPTSPQK